MADSSLPIRFNSCSLLCGLAALDDEATDERLLRMGYTHSALVFKQ
jgi:hypothetical protein